MDGIDESMRSKLNFTGSLAALLTGPWIVVVSALSNHACWVFLMLFKPLTHPFLPPFRGCNEISNLAVWAVHQLLMPYAIMIQCMELPSAYLLYLKILLFSKKRSAGSPSPAPPHSSLLLWGLTSWFPRVCLPSNIQRQGLIVFVWSPPSTVAGPSFPHVALIYCTQLLAETQHQEYVPRGINDKKMI